MLSWDMLSSTMDVKTRYSVIVDEYSKFIYVCLISQKNETQDQVKEFVGTILGNFALIQWQN